MNKHTSIKLLGLGLDAHFRAMLRVFFERRRRTRYEFVDRDPDVVIGDMDVSGAQKSLAEYREGNKLTPVILFSINELEYKTGGDFVVLRKPFTLKQLVSAFDIVDLSLGSRPQRLTPLVERDPNTITQAEPLAEMPVIQPQNDASQAHVEANQALHFRTASSLSRRRGSHVKLNTLLSRALDESSEGDANIDYHPDAYLQGALMTAWNKAKRKHKNIRIEFGSGSITIDTADALAEMRMGSFQLREIASFPINPEKAQILILPRRQARVDIRSGRTITSFDSLLWKLSLFASRGRVPAGTNLSRLVCIRNWPNFTRLMLFPGALRIAALWVEQPLSITQMQKMLNIPLQDVRSFYSAAQATGLIQTRKLDKVTPAHFAGDEKTGIRKLLGNILRKRVRHE